MKIKEILFLMVCALSAIPSKAVEKVIIGIVPFNYSETDQAKQAEQLQNIITRVFNENKQISLLDRSKVALIQKELNIQKGKEYIGGKTVKQNKSIGAQFIIIGNLTNIDIERSQFATTISYKSKVSFTLQKVNVTTGEVEDTKVFSFSTNDGVDAGGVYKKENDPKKNAINVNTEKIYDEVKDWVVKLFPPVLKFYELDEEKDNKGFPKYLTLVNDDNNLLIEKGDLIMVARVEIIPFEDKLKTRKTEIATLKVKEMQGDFIKCSITVGEKTIQKEQESHKLEFTKKAGGKPVQNKIII